MRFSIEITLEVSSTDERPSDADSLSCDNVSITEEEPALLPLLGAEPVAILYDHALLLEVGDTIPKYS